jgi:AraC-like DNA-binding protein
MNRDIDSVDHAGHTDTPDPVLAAIEQARIRRDQADRDIRILLAYAREFTRPRPYRLIDLAQAAGMSISGVRVAYTRQHVEEARRLLQMADSHQAVKAVS